MAKLTVALGEYPHAQALLDGRVQAGAYQIEPVEVRPIIGAYRRMIRDLEFDVCELAPVSYLMGRQHGVPLTAIPVFLNRRFHHGDVQCAADSGIAVPRDLEGRRVGVRAYSVSTGVWIGGDPVPYGLEANEPSLRALVRYSRNQDLADADDQADMAALFSPGRYPDA